MRAIVTGLLCSLDLLTLGPGDFWKDGEACRSQQDEGKGREMSLSWEERFARARGSPSLAPRMDLVIPRPTCCDFYQKMRETMSRSPEAQSAFGCGEKIGKWNGAWG